MLPENIIYLSVLASAVAYFFYFKNMFYGQVRPNLISWFIWMLAPFLGAFFSFKAGAGLAALTIFIAGFGPLLVLFFSLFSKNSYWKITGFDLFCGFLSLAALLFYVFTHNLSISIIFAILSDALAYIPTLIKSWKFPETESAFVYFTGVFNNILALLIIKNWLFPVYSFQVYIILANLLELSFIYRRKIFGNSTFR